MKKITNILWSAIDWFLFVGTVVMVLLVFANVVGRYCFDYVFTSFEEIARVLFIWGTYLGSIVAMKEGTHIRVDLLLTVMKPGTRRICEIVSNVLTSAILILTIRVMMTLVIINIGNPLPMTKIPYGVVQGIIPFSMAIMVIINCLKLVDLIKNKPAAEIAEKGEAE